MQLPNELWAIILTKRRNMVWEERKAKIHKMLHNTILPRQGYRSRFYFHDYDITFFRTDHLEITVTNRRNRFTINHVLYLYTPNPRGVTHETRFAYCPTIYLF